MGVWPKVAHLPYLYFLPLRYKNYVLANFRFNLCEGSVDHVTDLCENMGEHVFKPLLQKSSSDFLFMSDALLRGVRPMVPLNDNDAFMEFTRRLLHLPAERLSRAYARAYVAFLTYVMNTMLRLWWVAIFVRPLLNGLLRFSMYGNKNLPIVAVLTMGKEVLQREPSLEPHIHQNRQRLNAAMAH